MSEPSATPHLLSLLLIFLCFLAAFTSHCWLLGHGMQRDSDRILGLQCCDSAGDPLLFTAHSFQTEGMKFGLLSSRLAALINSSAEEGPWHFLS